MYLFYYEDIICYNLFGWILVINISNYYLIYDVLRLCFKLWCYNILLELNILFYYGKYMRYDGGGYIVDLGYDLWIVLRVVINFKSNDWIDDRIVVIFVEFIIF